MEFRVLQYFLAIAREETISGAAEFLHITQPTLSRQMKELEEEFGKQLFIRGNRKITLTEDGMLLRKRAEEIIDLVEKTEMEMLSSDHTLSGDIHIGSGETIGIRPIIQAIEKIQKEYPLIKFHLFSGNGDDVCDKLDKGLIDFGLLVGSSQLSKYETLLLPNKDHAGVLMRKDSDLSKKEFITPDDLRNKPLILSRQDLKTNSIAKWFHQSIEDLNVIATYNLIYNASLLVEETGGYLIGLKGLINTSGDSPLCFIPLYPEVEIDLAFVWKKHQILSKASKLFLNTVQQMIE